MPVRSPPAQRHGKVESSLSVLHEPDEESWRPPSTEALKETRHLTPFSAIFRFSFCG